MSAIQEGSPKSSALDILHIAFPAATVVLFAALPTLRALVQSPNRRTLYTVGSGHGRWFRWLSPLVALTFVGHAVVSLAATGSRADAIVSNETLYAFAGILIWSGIGVILIEGTSPCWPAYIMAWTAGGVFDAVILGLSVSELSANDSWNSGLVGLQVLRVILFAEAAIHCFVVLECDSKFGKATDDETRRLLNNHTGDGDCWNSASTTEYGSVPVDANEDDDDDEADTEGKGDEDNQEIKAQQKRRLEEAGGWLGYLGTLLVFLPVILPYKHRPTQAWILVLLLCIGAQRFLTYMVPQQFSILTEAIGTSVATGQVPWKELVIWAVLNFPIEAGLGTLQSMAGIRISQFAYQQLTTLAFRHVMNLSMDYHTSKSTGRVTKAIEQGSNLSYMLDNMYRIAPIFVDFFVAIVVLSSKFDPTMGFIILSTSMIHTYVAYKGNLKTAQIERQVNENRRGENETLYDSISNWQTVAYHNRQKYEEDRYATSIWKAVRSQRAFYDFYEFINLLESCVMEVGLVAAAALVAKRVADGTDSFRSFVFVISYWDTIRSPMSMLAWNIRAATMTVIDAEWLYQLIKTEPSVQDREGAKDIQLQGGKVEFKNVSFSYDVDRPILQDISFTAEPGQRIALVGETGGGKSTTLKLLYRFYDVTAGSISIDGQDLRDVTLTSLRDVLGAVPQDPSVFDQTLMENVLYARPGASESEAIDACKAARIHHQIMKFPNGYKTRLGERGVRLSGGELQRLAIARVILRQPKIVVLDEATSAVDSETESLIQQAIGALSSGRTVFMIAHRLSTVVGADLILVVDQGKIVERGSHRDLLAMGGKYARLWNMQTLAE
ncbi:hypothetical protein QQS21_001217 [Conoideocrella luteorostrata]|uniref:Heavy metal tolerance protein n=1 Tax=Conoideocrella luteorostrata TaxID=1105319 RepID=A0AAJ0G3J4_9HYPO|nr:hypothetical protein QQS21_001217 [Conoideocrella luteorostrata]